MKTISDHQSQYIKSELQIMYAVELLEYHNKNYLSGNNKTRCEKRLEQLSDLLSKLNQITNNSDHKIKSLPETPANEEKEYTVTDLVSFGLFMTSTKREKSFYDGTQKDDPRTLKERLQSVHDADIANWLEERNINQ